jgi:hypothetical protein
MTPEAKVVQRIKALVKSYGGEVRKVEWSGRRCAPDLLVLMPGHHFFVEVKAPGEKPRPEQVREHERLRVAGFDVFVSDGDLEPIENELKTSRLMRRPNNEACDASP